MGLKPIELHLDMSEEFDFIDDYKKNILPERARNDKESAKRRDRMSEV